MNQVTITALPNASYKVTGPVTLLDVKGRETALPEGKEAYLCRCGFSKNKPFCDGSHKTCGFRDEG